jgi:hypothetical protein
VFYCSHDQLKHVEVAPRVCVVCTLSSRRRYKVVSEQLAASSLSAVYITCNRSPHGIYRSPHGIYILASRHLQTYCWELNTELLITEYWTADYWKLITELLNCWKRITNELYTELLITDYWIAELLKANWKSLQTAVRATHCNSIVIIFFLSCWSLIFTVWWTGFDFVEHLVTGPFEYFNFI